MNEKPIFLKLMDIVEDGIISGVYKAGDLVISSTQICKLYNVNPATAMRALSELGDGGILVKDRGVGMRVTEGAIKIISTRRKAVFMDSLLDGIVDEAKKLNISKNELVELIEQKYENLFA